MPGRRPYRLGKRASSVAETKRRILDAATIEYAENGIEATTMQAVARRANVAAGTVLYHYPTSNALAKAAIAAWTDAVQLPGAADIDPAADLDERLRQLVRATFELYARADWTYRILQKSAEYPLLAAARDTWEGRFRQMIAVALGDRSEDIEGFQVVSSLVDPGFWVTLQSRGVTSERAIELVTSLASAWMGRPSEGTAARARR